MMKYLNASILIALSAIIFANPVFAKNIQQSHKGITLNANLELAAGKSLKDGVILITHGTLAHNQMEIVRTLQKLFKERGYNTLAINLGLGINNRAGMHECATLHTHKHTDAIDEIGLWLGWLKHNGASKVFLLGHSRGGNQTAWFAAEHDDPAIRGVMLVAPMTWSADAAAAAYKSRYGVALNTVLTKAEALVRSNKGDEWLSKTGFIYCRDAKVTAASFVSYYKPDPRLDTPSLLKKINKPVVVFAGTEDTVVKGLDKIVAPIADGKRIKLVVVEGAGHMFLEFFSEDIADSAVSFMKDK